MAQIEVYVPNLKYRKDRRMSIKQQFADKDEFSLNIVDAIELKNGAFGLWQTFYNITCTEQEKGSKYFIFCEDDHIFTENYSWEYLKNMIETADNMEADLLSGGMSVVNIPVCVCNNLFWVSSFNGMQFTVVFNRLYERITKSKTAEGYITDIHLSRLARNKFVMFPYISEQKDFGYSDATKNNNRQGWVSSLFKTAQSLLEKLYKCKNYFSHLPSSIYEDVLNTDVSDVCIPTYIINLKERTDRLKSVLNQFKDRKEFQVTVVPACKNEIGAVGLWNSICGIVKKAKDEDEDCILICEDDHVFTENYHAKDFLRQVMLAGSLGAQLLNGGIGGFGNLVPVKDGLYWCDWFWCTQFIVVYKNAYDIILNTTFRSSDVADEKLSAILTNKMVTVPFISEQTDFGYSDITEENNTPSNILRYFDDSKNILKHYEYVERMFSNNSNVSEASDNKMAEYDSLHLGCGHNILKGWLNTDLNPTYGAEFLDVTQKFTLQKNSMKYVYMEHLLENFSMGTVRHILEECHRVLKHGGVIRITIFSDENLLKLYNGNDFHDMEQYVSWNIANYNSDGFIPQEKSLRHSAAFSNFMNKMQKCHVYDYTAIESLLKAAGFNNICRCDFTKSSHSHLNGICGYKSYMPKEMYQFETLTIEASKL